MLPIRGLPAACFTYTGMREQVLSRVICALAAIAFIGMGIGAVREILGSGMTPLQTTLLAIIVGGDCVILVFVFAYAALTRD